MCIRDSFLDRDEQDVTGTNLTADEIASERARYLERLAAGSAIGEGDFERDYQDLADRLANLEDRKRRIELQNLNLDPESALQQAIVEASHRRQLELQNVNIDPEGTLQSHLATNNLVRSLNRAAAERGGELSVDVEQGLQKAIVEDQFRNTVALRAIRDLEQLGFRYDAENDKLIALTPEAQARLDSARQRTISDTLIHQQELGENLLGTQGVDPYYDENFSQVPWPYYPEHGPNPFYDTPKEENIRPIHEVLADWIQDPERNWAYKILAEMPHRAGQHLDQIHARLARGEITLKQAYSEAWPTYAALGLMGLFEVFGGDLLVGGAKIAARGGRLGFAGGRVGTKTTSRVFNYVQDSLPWLLPKPTVIKELAQEGLGDIRALVTGVRNLPTQVSGDLATVQGRVTDIARRFTGSFDKVPTQFVDEATGELVDGVAYVRKPYLQPGTGKRVLETDRAYYSEYPRGNIVEPGAIVTRTGQILPADTPFVPGEMTRLAIHSRAFKRTGYGPYVPTPTTGAQKAVYGGAAAIRLGSDTIPGASGAIGDIVEGGGEEIIKAAQERAFAEAVPASEVRQVPSFTQQLQDAVPEQLGEAVDRVWDTTYALTFGRPVPVPAPSGPAGQVIDAVGPDDVFGGSVDDFTPGSGEGPGEGFNLGDLDSTPGLDLSELGDLATSDAVDDFFDEIDEARGDGEEDDGDVDDADADELDDADDLDDADADDGEEDDGDEEGEEDDGDEEGDEDDGQKSSDEDDGKKSSDEDDGGDVRGDDGDTADLDDLEPGLDVDDVIEDAFEGRGDFDEFEPARFDEADFEGREFEEPDEVKPKDAEEPEEVKPVEEAEDLWKLFDDADDLNYRFRPPRRPRPPKKDATPTKKAGDDFLPGIPFGPKKPKQLTSYVDVTSRYFLTRINGASYLIEASPTGTRTIEAHSPFATSATRRPRGTRRRRQVQVVERYS